MTELSTDDSNDDKEIADNGAETPNPDERRDVAEDSDDSIEFEIVQKSRYTSTLHPVPKADSLNGLATDPLMPPTEILSRPEHQEEHVEWLEPEQDTANEREIVVSMKRQRNGENDDTAVAAKKLHNESIETHQITAEPSATIKTDEKPVLRIDLPKASVNAVESNDEETLFALSLVGTLKRLPPQKFAAAKCHILTYLMNLEYGDASSTAVWDVE